jgi:ribonuclease HII
MGVEATGLLESRLLEAGFTRIAGADEVGRGALAGPLVAAAVILPERAEIPGLRDSKLCTFPERARLAEQIFDVALATSVVRVRPDKIDRRGLQRCNLEALRRSLKGLGIEPDYVLFDGFPMKRLPLPHVSVKKGDVVSTSVAAASIVAKVHRDRIMSRYHREFPVYGFKTNFGYGTPEHWAALRRHGPSRIHRRSFYGVTGFPESGDHGTAEARDLAEIDLHRDDLQGEGTE